jgi:hypothetical protein
MLGVHSSGKDSSVQPNVLDTFTANYLKAAWVKADARTEKRDERGVDITVHARVPEPKEVEAAFAAYRVKDPKPTVIRL